MKKFLKVLFQTLLVFLAPIAMMGWQMADGVKWWVAALAGLGVLLVIAYVMMFFTVIAAKIKVIREAGKK
ncbi:MAG: hypothetical protein HDS97_06320 [Bacteroidales bacterium]|nr:hypothetical protein [Bacteroidales bacterium]